MKRRVAVLVDKGKIEIVDEDIPHLGKNDVLIKVGACGICSGDLYGFSGYPVWFNLPAPLGHEPSGEVVEVGTDVTKVVVGDHVTALGGPGFSDYVVVDESHVAKVPKNLPFEYAIGEPPACAVNGVRLANPRFGDNVGVVGTGFMGLLLIQLLSNSGLSNLIGIDLSSERLKLAKYYGASEVLNPMEENFVEEVFNLTEGRGLDIVIEATGSPTGVELATRLVKRKGRLAIFSYHPKPVSVDLRTWDAKGLEVVMTNPSRAEDMRENLKIAVRTMERGILSLEKLITHRWSLSEIQKAFKYTSSKPEGYIKGVIIP